MTSLLKTPILVEPQATVNCNSLSCAVVNDTAPVPENDVKPPVSREKSLDQDHPWWHLKSHSSQVQVQKSCPASKIAKLVPTCSKRSQPTPRLNKPHPHRQMSTPPP
ncbi:Deaminated glutathione amidase [Fusarium oxysporum f. sp. albedinis]|nr:Deaminated glutathione amidase [Fusarium oxysporum f. sp. albedinis]